MQGQNWPLKIFVQALLIEDYVLTLDTIVRLKALVEGLGIGKRETKFVSLLIL